ncbi:hypothetical protein V5F77_04150 [Xanthobacter sp. DSM 24535]|uniref:hypothetical protein n=1 Tax=Roseixanthobacter psychrophilus TaxID=3119917 RepID=UPI00372944ED
MASEPKPPAPTTPTPKPPAQDKSARLAQALRANLARRKAQGRARRDVEQDPDALDAVPQAPDLHGSGAPPSPADPAPDDATSGGLEPAIIVPKGGPC